MRWPDLIQTSLASLRQRMLRTIMTVLGVLIGTTSVVVMVSLGIGMTESMLSEMRDNATMTRVTVYPGSDGGGGGGMFGPMPSGGATSPKDKVMNAQTMAELLAYEGVEKVTPVYTVMAHVQVGQESADLQVTGVPGTDLPDEGLKLTEGRLPEKGDGLALLVGNMVANYWFPYDQSSMEPAKVNWMDQQVFVSFPNEWAQVTTDNGGGTTQPTAAKKFIVPVTGMFGAQTDFSAGNVYVDLDYLVDALRKSYPGKALPGQPALADGSPKSSAFQYSQLYLKADTPERAEELTTQLRQEGYSVSSNIEMMRAMQRSSMIVQAVFGGIGFISLLVAAIGIANTMMMSVYERTKQIGVMKVLGASLTDIRNLFLVESGFIGLFGGLVGLLLSYLLSGILNLTLGAAASAGMGDPMKISLIPPWLALSAIVFSTLIGTMAGLMPANRAMKLSPLAAIRSE